MNKKKLTRIIAVVMACMSMGVFAFSGCGKKGGTDDGTGGPGIVGDSEVAVTKVEISGNSSVKVGGKITLTAAVTPDNATHKSVTWSITEGSESAEIDGNGQLTGKAVGSVKVKATAGGVSGTFDVTVVENSGGAVAVTGVTLDKDELELTAGGMATLKATVAPDNADDQTYSWSSDDTAVATVKNGVVTAVSAGTANITVTTTDGGHTATCAVTVKAAAKPVDPDAGVNEPVVTGPVQGGPTITKSSKNELEAAYVQWTEAENANAKWYNVYYSVAGADSWTKLDAPLVRQYKDYFRADAVGLKAGSYDMKVVPVSGDDNEEATEYAATASGITVKAHTREGYAFVNGTSSGAYNEDGTLKNGANVIYVTDANKDTVELNGVTGLQNILQAQKKATAPLSVRLVGNVTSPEIPDKQFNKNPNSLQIKENGQGITLEGIGNDATANGWTIRLVNSVNVEVRNLGVMNTKCSEPDGISIEKGNHIWVHNCDIFYGGAGGDSDQAKGDGALDTKLASYVTHSYNHFYDTGKSNLQGMKDESTSNYITYHHNWYDHSDSRHPRIRTCTTHIYNNYFDGNAKYCVGVTTGASAFVENNYFRSTSTMKPMLVSSQGTDAKGEGTFSGESGGVIKAFGNYFDGKYRLITQNDTADKSGIDCYLATTRDEVVPAEYTAKAGSKSSEGAGNKYTNFDTASDFYEYTPDSAEQAKVNVQRYAGRMEGGDFKWEFDNATEDSNYALIPALKTALGAYKNDLTKVGGIAVTSGSTGGNGGEGSDEEGGNNPPATVDGEIVLNPAGTIPSQFTMGGGASSKSVAVTIDGISVEAKKGWKMNSSGTVTFTVTEDMTLTLYCSANLLKVNGTGYTGTSYTTDNGVSIYKITVQLTVTDGSKQFVVSQGSGESILYLLKLTPVE